jgi:hypothetical protein
MISLALGKHRIWGVVCKRGDICRGSVAPAAALQNILIGRAIRFRTGEDEPRCEKGPGAVRPHG